MSSNNGRSPKALRKSTGHYFAASASFQATSDGLTRSADDTSSDSGQRTQQSTVGDSSPSRSHASGTQTTNVDEKESSSP